MYYKGNNYVLKTDPQENISVKEYLKELLYT